MTGLSWRTLILAAIAALLLICANLWLEPDYGSKFAPTSFGTGPSGYKAAFDLATESGLPITRSYLNPNRKLPICKLLLVSPFFLGKESSGGEKDARSLLEWIRAGGTAIVLGTADSEWERLGISARTYTGTEHVAVTGDFVSAMRRLDVPNLLHFDTVPKNAQVQLRADNAPFALERVVGKGRLIAIADGGFLRNQYLGDADNSLLFIDLMRHFEKIKFDEYSHGMVEDITLSSAIMDSQAIFPIGIALMLAIMWILAQQKWPARLTADDLELPSPSIEPFVVSLGVLYSRSSDSEAAFRAYRNGFLNRLRLKMMPIGATNEEVMLQRVASDRALSVETGRWLLGPSVPRNNLELLQAVRAIEAYGAIANG
jgi:Domain of unknown function (DUF4350)